jgi:hypothetical protein
VRGAPARRTCPASLSAALLRPRRELAALNERLGLSADPVGERESSHVVALSRSATVVPTWSKRRTCDRHGWSLQFLSCRSGPGGTVAGHAYRGPPPVERSRPSLLDTPPPTISAARTQEARTGVLWMPTRRHPATWPGPDAVNLQRQLRGAPGASACDPCLCRDDLVSVGVLLAGCALMPKSGCRNRTSNESQNAIRPIGAPMGVDGTRPLACGQCVRRLPRFLGRLDVPASHWVLSCPRPELAEWTSDLCATRLDHLLMPAPDDHKH